MIVAEEIKARWRKQEDAEKIEDLKNVDLEVVTSSET